MSALPIRPTQTTALTPVDVPKLRAVSTRRPLDVPALVQEPVRRPVLRAVPEAPVQPTPVKDGLERVLDVATVGFTIAAGAAFAMGLQYWLTF